MADQFIGIVIREYNDQASNADLGNEFGTHVDKGYYEDLEGGHTHRGSHTDLPSVIDVSRTPLLSYPHWKLANSEGLSRRFLHSLSFRFSVCVVNLSQSYTFLAIKRREIVMVYL